jgi:hypothetical protein
MIQQSIFLFIAKVKGLDHTFLGLLGDFPVVVLLVHQ